MYDGRRAASDMSAWYMTVPCVVLAFVAACLWMQRRRRTLARTEAAREVTISAVTISADNAGMPRVSGPSHVREHIPVSPYIVPRAAPAVIGKTDDIEVLDLDQITLEDETKLRENFSGESVFQMKQAWLDRQLRKLHTGAQMSSQYCFCVPYF